MSIKVLTNPSKPRKEGHRYYFTDIIYKMIMMVKAIDNLQ